MAFTHDITIKIKFNEHDNEKDFLNALFKSIEQLKNSMDSAVHEDIFFDVDMPTLRQYMTPVQKVKQDLRLTGFRDWN